MKKTIPLLAILMAELCLATPLVAATARTATEIFVTNKIAAAISQIPPPDYSTNNVALVETIEATAPAPGNYAVVSNAAVHAAITNALQDAAISTLSDYISTLNDTKADRSDLDPLLFAQYYPEGNVSSAAEFTQGIKYGSFDDGNRTVSVLPFCNTGDSDYDNSGLEGRVVIPPFVDAQGNPYITDDGTRYKVVGVSEGFVEGGISPNLTAIVAPNTVTDIGISAFHGCTLLASISLPAAENIGANAFYYGALTSVSLPAAKSVGESAFQYCPLTSVSLPAAESIGLAAFAYCISLALVDFGDTPRSSVPSLGVYAFGRVPSNCTIIVPYTQYDEWIAADGWKDLQQEFVRHAEKADKPVTFTMGNFAEFDANGNPVDSGKKPSDFANATNVYTKSETEAKIVELAPAPGEYGAVSNKAMNALSRAEAGLSAWSLSPNPQAPWSLQYEVANGLRDGGWFLVIDSQRVDFCETDETATTAQFTDYTATRTSLPTMADIPTEQIDAATTTNALQDTAIGDLSNDNAQTRQIVTTWENFLDGSNVVFSITNYLSGSYNLDAAKLRILELREGEYHEVFNSRDEILLHIENFRTNDFRVATNELVGAVNEAIGGKADRDWGKYTSAGGDAPANTVYMTAPNTVFAGGLEYERVAVGEGTICVLTTRGAPVWTQGDEGTFKFQDDGGINYFGFAKTDSYTIGANTDGITVQGGMVTMNYNITMSGRPCVWYKSSLSSGAWEQLNLPDGSPVAGASHAVTWEANPDPGTQVCYINVGNAPSGFFRATVEVTGEAKFMTNMPADMSGGIVCPNTATGVSGVIKPTFNGTTVIWTWSAK